MHLGLTGQQASLLLLIVSAYHQLNRGHAALMTCYAMRDPRVLLPGTSRLRLHVCRRHIGHAH